ncbi:MAG: NAD-dependent epimerase/dehydratase family protein, partial [Candidatus Helarchaeota archaeon]
MNIQMLEAARINNIDKYLFMSSACGYPLEAPVPLTEDYFFEGKPEPTNGTYGHAKRIGEIQAKAYKEEYGMKIAIARPFNAYGPRDNFNLEESHVIPALITKAVERQSPFKIWSNGEATRAFIYVSDIVDGLLLMMEKYAVCDPLNIGRDEEIKIKDLAFLILKLSGYSDAKVEFELDKPAGQPRRSASIKKAKEKINFLAKVPLEEGILHTINWYKQNFH